MSKFNSPRLYRLVFEEWEGRCAYCGEEATTIDHVLPRILGGPDEHDNLVPACAACNGQKYAYLLDEWDQRLAAQIDELEETLQLCRKRRHGIADLRERGIGWSLFHRPECPHAHPSFIATELPDPRTCCSELVNA